VKVATLVTFLSLVKTLDQVMRRLSRVHTSGRMAYQGPDESDAKTCASSFENSYKGTGSDGMFQMAFSPFNRCGCRILQMATLSVQEAMGQKVDREAVATLVLPQLWAMSIGPCTLHLRLASPLL
jgi:hypothetical protein